jgi:hypothetical protein
MVMFRSDEKSPPRPTAEAIAPRHFPNGVRGRGEAATILDRPLPAADLFGASLEPRDVLQALGEIVVPALGIWLAVGFSSPIAESAFGIPAKGDPSRLVLVEFFHSGPELGPALRTVLSEFPFAPEDMHGPEPVDAAGRAQVPAQVCDLSRMRFTVALGQDAGSLVRLSAHTAHALTVHLAVADRVIGAMTIGAPAGPRPEWAVLSDLGRCATTALEHAFVHAREQRRKRWIGL